VPRAVGKASDIDSCGLTYSELQELWLGPCNGSVFSSPEELRDAWASGRAVVMRLWGSHGRRPCAWWAFDTALEHPGYAKERSFLYEHNELAPAERTELEAEWRREYDAACRMDARERREHLEHCDVPVELVTAWEAERKAVRRRRRTAKGAPPEEAVVAE
jgi:hypothetical protein